MLLVAWLLLPAPSHAYAAWQEQAAQFAQHAAALWAYGERIAGAWSIANGTPLLRDWILRSRERAVAAGTAPIPTPIRLQLAGFFPEATLRRARYRIGFAHEPAAPAQLFRLLRVRAVTLDHVIVFRNAQLARDPVLWAHELAHVEQYQSWGVDRFAERYLSDREAVESAAWERAARYKMWALERGQRAAARR